MNDPHDYPPSYSMATYLWVAWLSMFGASSAYLIKLRGQSVNSFSLFGFVIEVVVSGFTGLIAFHVCDYQGLDPRLTAVVIAISSHFSTRALFLFRQQVIGGGEE